MGPILRERFRLQDAATVATRAQIDAASRLEAARQPLDHALVEILAAQVGVSRGRAHLVHALADAHHRDVEGPTPQVEDRDRLVGVFLHAVGERLVDPPGGELPDRLDVEVGNGVEETQQVIAGDVIDAEVVDEERR